MWGEKAKVRDFLLIANQDFCLRKDLKGKREKTHLPQSGYSSDACPGLEGKTKMLWGRECVGNEMSLFKYPQS